MAGTAEHEVVQASRPTLGEMNDVVSFTPRWRALTPWVAALPVANDERRPKSLAYGPRSRPVVKHRRAPRHHDAVQLGVTRQPLDGLGGKWRPVHQFSWPPAGKLFQLDHHRDMRPGAAARRSRARVVQEPPAEVHQSRSPALRRARQGELGSSRMGAWLRQWPLRRRPCLRGKGAPRARLGLPWSLRDEAPRDDKAPRGRLWSHPPAAARPS